MDLLTDLKRGSPANRVMGAPPSAEFVPIAEIAGSQTLGYREGKIFLGLVSAKVDGPNLERVATGGAHIGVSDNRHMITIAGTRAGKGRGAIIPNILLYPGSILATDPKGELATITARRRRDQMRQNVHVLDPFGVTKGEAVKSRKGFNPIQAMRDENLIEDAALLSDALVVQSEGSKDPHWDESARSFIEGLILYVRTAKEYRIGDKLDGSLIDVRQLSSIGAIGPDNEYSMTALQTLMATNDALDGPNEDVRDAGRVIVSAAADFFERPLNERGSVLSTVRRHLKFLDYPGIRKSVSTHDFELEELKHKPTTIYLCLPARHIGTCSRWLRMFVNLTLQAMEREGGEPVNGVPVLCCLDEFASLGRMKQIEDAAGQIAGFGVKLWPILQDLGQLKAMYEDKWETFLGNAGILQFFGNNDLTTLEWISKRCDKTYIRTREDRAQTATASSDGASSMQWRTEVHDLITPGEASLVFGRYDHLVRQLIIWAGQPPMILQRAFYDQHHLFKGQFDGLPKTVRNP